MPDLPSEEKERWRHAHPQSAGPYTNRAESPEPNSNGARRCSHRNPAASAKCATWAVEGAPDMHADR